MATIGSVPTFMRVLATAVGFVLLWVAPASADTFKAGQRRFPRVRAALSAKSAVVAQTFKSAGLAFPPERIFLRIFKHENQVELWAGGRKGKLSRVKVYPVCYASGEPGPKRRRGDEQVPEGFYHIDRFNPRSNFLLSLGLNYPNRSDRILGHKGDLGGDIFIHGSCVSVGCVAITDALIQEVYIIAVEARNRGQRRIPVHVFPRRMDTEGMAALTKEAGTGAERLAFWRNLQDGYTFFEDKRVLPRVSVGRDGRYRFR